MQGMKCILPESHEESLASLGKLPDGTSSPSFPLSFPYVHLLLLNPILFGCQILPLWIFPQSLGYPHSPMPGSHQVQCIRTQGKSCQRPHDPKVRGWMGAIAIAFLKFPAQIIIQDWHASWSCCKWSLLAETLQNWGITHRVSEACCQPDLIVLDWIRTLQSKSSIRTRLNA